MGIDTTVNACTRCGLSDCPRDHVCGGGKHRVGDACPGGHQDLTEEGFKFDAGKLRYDLVPPSSLAELALVYTDGAQKYGDENYMKGMSWRRVTASLLRHVEAYRAGESTDSESGSPHLAHAAWACFTLMLYELYGLGEDDRVAKEVSGIE